MAAIMAGVSDGPVEFVHGARIAIAQNEHHDGHLAHVEVGANV